MKPVLLFLGLVVAAVSSSAADRTPLVGVWKLLSYQTEFQDGTPKRATFGEHPSGYIIFTGEGRMMAVLEAEARKVPSSDAERAALLRSMFVDADQRLQSSLFAVSARWSERKLSVRAR